MSELISDCGVNRKTFYYHFENIYALLTWMLEQESIEIIWQFDWMVHYTDAVQFTIDYSDPILTESRRLLLEKGGKDVYPAHGMPYSI
ncbi:TetR/AcrR family transcriptional regulator [Eubacteriales bacterium OttesenSCG-928-A19]|nr:TetR/AcrR family transcriptional regulator [Eubacteriales bacterium OttesenSCG-928-A19]